MCKNHDHANPENKAAGISRRDALRGVAAAGAAGVAAAVSGRAVAQSSDAYAEPAEPALPPSTMKLDLSRAALVVTDPQIDFLHPEGVTWGVIGESVKEHNTVENIETLFKTAKQAGITVAVSPHYYYPTDHGWKFEGALEKLMHKICLLYTSPSPRDGLLSRMPSSA